MRCIKFSTYITIVFVLVLLVVPHGVMPESLITDVMFGLGSAALFIHYFSMLWNIWKERRWSYILGSVVLFFIPTLIYYFTIYAKREKSA